MAFSRGMRSGQLGSLVLWSVEPHDVDIGEWYSLVRCPSLPVAQTGLVAWYWFAMVRKTGNVGRRAVS